MSPIVLTPGESGSYRTTIADLRRIVVTLDSTITETEIAIYQRIAYNIVQDKLVPLNSTSTRLTADRLEDIELYLAAHFAAVSQTRTSAERAGSIWINYMHKVGLNFNQTVYGQQALILDTTGTLAGMQRMAEKGGGSSIFNFVGYESDDTINYGKM